MGEEFQGGLCGGTWWNSSHNLFSGGLWSPCSVAQLGGGGAFDMDNFGWQNEVIKGKFNNNPSFDNLIFPDQMNSSLDILGFGLSPTSSTTDWNHHQNLIYTNNNCNVDNQQGASPPMALTASSNSSGDSSTITCEGGGGLATSFPMNSPASYLIQSLFDDSDESQVVLEQQQSMAHNNHFINTSNYGSLDLSSEIISSNSWVKLSPDNTTTQASIPSQLQLVEDNNKISGGVMMNALINGGGHEQVLSDQYSPTTLSNIRASLLNSLQSRSRGNTSMNQKSHSCASKVNNEEHRRETKNNDDQPSVKRPRIETPSPLPTFKVRKEKLGDRITALQQLVSPFGKTDTASVLHEAIEYIKFLHDQVNVLSTPYLKSGTPMQQQGCEKLKENEEGKQDLRSRGLCLVPISSTYPVAQETAVDFWTPTFGGTTFR